MKMEIDVNIIATCKLRKDGNYHAALKVYAVYDGVSPDTFIAYFSMATFTTRKAALEHAAKWMNDCYKLKRIPYHGKV